MSCLEGVQKQRRPCRRAYLGAVCGGVVDGCVLGPERERGRFSRSPGVLACSKGLSLLRSETAHLLPVLCIAGDLVAWMVHDSLARNMAKKQDHTEHSSCSSPFSFATVFLRPEAAFLSIKMKGTRFELFSSPTELLVLCLMLSCGLLEAFRPSHAANTPNFPFCFLTQSRGAV